MTAIKPADRPAPPRWRLVLEAVFPVAAGQAYIWSVPHDRPRWLDVALAAAVFAVVAIYVVRGPFLSWRTFGLARGREHLRAALPIGLFTLAVVTGLLLWGWRTDGLRQDWDVAAALAAYPVWGFVQQAVMFGVAYPRLRAAAGARAAAPLVAVLFAAAHAPNPMLMIGGGLMVLVFALVWEQAPSLPVLALSHGIIGAVCDKALHVSMRVGAHFFAG